ncbi:MAG: CHRD domain-containing protein [Candidatus Latescibacteria bacterium]|nr:CHRD domain-containing protein [Candidatus Latescibacterota bacterium]
MNKHTAILTAVAAMAWMFGCGQQDPVSSTSGGADSPAAKLVVSRTKAGGGLGAGRMQSGEGPRVFSAVITGDQEVPGVTTEGSGTGTFTLNAAKTQLSFKITIHDLSAIAAAHFHNAATGINGGVVRGFAASEITQIGTDTWRVNGVWTSSDTQALTPALVQALEAGSLYVNFHTADHKAGELRGQVEPL